MKVLPAEILAHIDDRRYAAVHVLEILHAAAAWVENGGHMFTPSSLGRKSGGPAWTGGVHSSVGYPSNIVMSVEVAQLSVNWLAGFNDTPAASTGYTDINYAWHLSGGTNALKIYENGVDTATHGTAVLGDTVSISYDGVTVRYYKNGTLVRSVAQAAGSDWSFDASFFETSATPHIRNVSFGPTPLRWTDAPFPIPYGGDTYTQQWFSVGDIVIDDAGNQTVSLAFPDVGRIVRGLLYNEDWSYRPATLREVWLEVDASGRVMFDANHVPTVLNAHTIADGRADGGTANFEEHTEPVSISIVPDTEAEGATGPAQEYEGSCRYVRAFRGLQCGYAGVETTCDGTFARCTALSNTARYGGFRFAPKPGSTISVGVGSTTVGTR